MRRHLPLILALLLLVVSATAATVRPWAPIHEREWQAMVTRHAAERRAAEKTTTEGLTKLRGDVARWADMSTADIRGESAGRAAPTFDAVFEHRCSERLAIAARQYHETQALLCEHWRERAAQRLKERERGLGLD